MLKYYLTSLRGKLDMYIFRRLETIRATQGHKSGNGYKCRYCNFRSKTKYGIGQHYETSHRDMIPDDISGYRWYYYHLTGKEKGSCIICKSETEFNEPAMKYARFCKKKSCKQEYREQFKNRMIAKYGKVHLLDDPEKQKEMLANRKISGKYQWSDGTEIQYTGSYESDFLKYLDKTLNWKSSDILAPSPHVYEYEYEEKTCLYLPDFFIPSLSLEIEIKDNGDAKQINQASREKDKLKEDLMRSNKNYFNYLLIKGKDYTEFLELIKEDT